MSLELYEVNWVPVGAVVAAIIAFLATYWAARTTVRDKTVAELRQGWLLAFRTDLGIVLAAGREIYDPVPDENPAAARERLIANRIRIREASYRLAALAGREKDQRVQFATLVARFADSPNREASRQIEELAQEIFRYRWDQIKNFDTASRRPRLPSQVVSPVPPAQLPSKHPPE